MSRLRHVWLYDANGNPIVQSPVIDPIEGTDIALLTKAVITGMNDEGAFLNVRTTHDGTLRVSDDDDGLAIAAGEVPGRTVQHKFGLVPNFGTTTGKGVVVWDGSDALGLNQPEYIYSTAPIIDSLSSSDAADVQPILIVGLDTNWNEVWQTVYLQGQIRVVLPIPLIRCYRGFNAGLGIEAVNFAGTIYAYEDTPIVDGVPTDTTKVRAVVSIGRNQTLMAVYTVPAGKTAYIRKRFSSLANEKKDIASVLTVEARRFGGVFRVVDVFTLLSSGSSDSNVDYIEPIMMPEKTDIQLLATSDQDGAAVSGGFDMVVEDNPI